MQLGRTSQAPWDTSSGLRGRYQPRSCFTRHQPRTVRAAAGDPKPTDSQEVWAAQGFPSYLQSRVENIEFCQSWAEEIAQAERQQSLRAHEAPTTEPGEVVPAVWQAIRREALRDAAAEPMLSSFLYASILAHESFERALAFVLSNRLANATMLPTQLFEIFHDVLYTDEDVRLGALADVEACRERDPSCSSYSQALLYYKGFHAIQTHRIAHCLWHRGQKIMALMLQSRISEVFAVDIHPAARIGRGVLLDHGTGVVIGETAVIGNNCSLLQNVTLGGTGKEVGDRHPKICDNVLIGASATVLGNITIGKGSQIAAGSLVLKPVPPRTMVAGSPASPVGKVSGNPALKMQQWMQKFKDKDMFCGPEQAPSASSAASSSSASTATPTATSTPTPTPPAPAAATTPAPTTSIPPTASVATPTSPPAPPAPKTQPSSAAQPPPKPSTTVPTSSSHIASAPGISSKVKTTLSTPAATTSSQTGPTTSQQTTSPSSSQPTASTPTPTPTQTPTASTPSNSPPPSSNATPSVPTTPLYKNGNKPHTAQPVPDRVPEPALASVSQAPSQPASKPAPTPAAAPTVPSPRPSSQPSAPSKKPASKGRSSSDPHDWPDDPYYMI